MARLALSLDRRTEETVLPGALKAGHTVVARVQTAGELAAALAAQQVDVALVAASRNRLAPEVRAAAAACGTRLVAVATTQEEAGVAAAAGVVELIAEPGSWQEVERMLRTEPAASVDAAHDAVPSAVAREREPSIVVVWGPAGAPGRSSLAIALAAELAEFGRRVALVDADSYGGAIAPMLGLLDEAPGFAAACRLAGSGAFTRAEFDRVAQYLPTRHGVLAVLTGMSRPTRWPELGEDRVRGALLGCAEWFDHVVVDVGFNLEADEEIASDLLAPRRNAATLAALACATHVVQLGAADPVGLGRLLRAHPDAVSAAPHAAHSIIVNRVRASAVGAQPEQQLAHALERFGGLRAAAMVPEDRDAFDAALLTAAPLPAAAPRSLAREALRAFASEVLAGLPPMPNGRRRRPREGRRRRREPPVPQPQPGEAAIVGAS